MKKAPKIGVELPACENKGQPSLSSDFPAGSSAAPVPLPGGYSVESLASLVAGTPGLSVGSRLVKVIDHHSKRIDARRRFHVTVRLVTRLVLVSIACSWLFLYLDSVHQRRRAESLFADLKSLDLATAGFPEVRDIMNRYGGRGIQRDLQPRFPDFGDPLPDEHGNSFYYPNPGPTCTPQNCTFQLWIMTRLPRIPLLNRTARFSYTTLPYIGVRSWVAYARFEVRNGKLDRSQTRVEELRMESPDSSGYRHLVPLGYEVETRKDAASLEYGACSNQDYRVIVSHGYFTLPADMLTTCVLQSAGTPTKRAFDVNLRCLNGFFRSCRFDELAPSAWADYSAKDGGTGTRDPHK
jgi:hypothetical protein